MSDSESLPSDIEESATQVVSMLLPEKLKIKYEQAYERLRKWCDEKKIKNEANENILLVYFENISKRYKPSSLWAYYSMIRAMISIKKNVDISKFIQLVAFLKRQSEGYKPKKSNILTKQHITRFLQEADDEKWLLTKGYDYIPLNDECMEELNLKYIFGEDSPEVQYNRTCVTKCTFQKDGKLDAEGNLIDSNFESEEQDAAVECWNLIKEDDLCKKVQALSNCIHRKSNDYWRTYDECERHNSYVEGELNNCHTRCEMIVDQTLTADGGVNFSSIVIYEENSENTATKEDALNMCKDFVADEDVCTYDLNMYYCITHILYHRSLKAVKNEIECGKKHIVYPFYGAYDSFHPRNCYDHCVMVKNEELNADNILESNAFKTLGISEEELREAYDTCKTFYHETDKCNSDLYFYDCINHLQYTNSDYLKNEMECALELKTPLFQFRQEYKENYCNTKCLMIKDRRLDEYGNLNKTLLELHTPDNAIIEESIKFCKERYHGNDCAQQVFLQYCADSKISDEIYKHCNAIKDQTKIDINNLDEGYYCSSRCQMIHGRQLDSDGEILIGPLVAQSPLKSAEAVEEAIKYCKAINKDKSLCTRDVETYYCVESQLWMPDEELHVGTVPFENDD